MVWFMSGAVSGAIAWVWLECAVSAAFPFCCGLDVPWWHAPVNLSIFLLILPIVLGSGFGLDRLAARKGWRKHESWEEAK